MISFFNQAWNFLTSGLANGNSSFTSKHFSRRGLDPFRGAGTDPMASDEVMSEQLNNDVGDIIWQHLVTLISICAQTGIVVGGVVPYIPQFLSIRKSRSTKGFSIYVCLALLLANTLRILFWFGHWYEIPLLVQSILMNLAMFALIYLCVKINNREVLVKGEEHIFTDFDPAYFWQWTDFQSYVEFVMTFGAIGGILMFIFREVDVFVETVGFLAVFTEALLGVPQFYRNYKNKSTYGMSVHMVLMWTCGDVFKTVYFYLRETPLQFIVCGSLQVMIDLSILSQVWIYWQNTSKKRKSEAHLNT